jgi:BatD DUF11 like domain
MIQIANLVALTLALASLAPASEPLKVTAVVSSKPYFAGQGIEVRVEVIPGEGTLTFDTPRIKDAEVFPMPPDPNQPSLRRFAVVPAHAGLLELPSFRVRSGDRSGASRPFKLAVASVPPEGRTSAFLGGVGTFDVKAEAEPSSVRVGETLEFRVRITGSAAWGSVRAPDLNEWNTPTLKVEAKDNLLQASETPARTFRYQVRPLKSGQVILPPLSLAAFDPTTRHYATRATASLALRVEEPPRFEPSLLDYPPVVTPIQGPRPGPVGLVVGALALVSGSVLAAWFATRRFQRSRALNPRRLALELSKGLPGGDDEVEAARAVTEALTTFLHRVVGRTPGVLTPPEARAGFARVTDNPALPSLAKALVTRCDRTRYGAGGNEARELIEEARRFFERLAGEVRKGEGPGEAVETVSDI